MAKLDLPHQRLLHQRISASTLREAAAVVDWLVAVQAQDYAGAKWAVGLRMRDATDGQVERAFNAGVILRTHVLRPTWHFVTPADIRWLLALTAPRVHSANGHMYRQLELDTAVFRKSQNVLAKALRGGAHLTRPELGATFAKAGIDVGDGRRLAYLLMRAELDGLICSGPRRGKQFTYALLDERVLPNRTLDQGQSLALLARRYFMSRGPATIRDFAKWSGLTIGDAREGLEAVKSELHGEVVDGQSYWFSASRRAARPAAPRAYLLSIYDEYISGYQDRRAMVNARYDAKLWNLGNALTYIVVLDGQVVGSWKRTIEKNRVTVQTNLFRRLTKPERNALADAADRYGAFLQLLVELVSSSGSRR